MLLASRPEGLVTSANLNLDDSAAIPSPGAGEALVKVHYLSIDPTIRGWMNDAPGYLPPIGLGEVIRSGGVGEVVESNNVDVPAGSMVFGMLGWQEYVIMTADAPFTVTLNHRLPWIPVTTPTSSPAASSSGPCSMCNSK